MRKRAFDLFVVSLAALAWIPVVLLTTAVALVASGRPVFYRSRRWVGPRQIITMAKFRVMVVDANRVKAPVECGRFLNTPSDSPLYTPLGRVLERLGITELPQLIHVLRGEMSVVGARPLTDDVRDCLGETHGYIDDRWLTPAGLTGPPQLVGREMLTDAQRLQLESAYSRAAVQRYRARLDFLILLYTVLIVLRLRKPMTFEQAMTLVHGKPRPARERQLVAARESDVTLAVD